MRDESEPTGAPGLGRGRLVALSAAVPDLLCLLVIAIVSWTFTATVARVFDIALYDESQYLWQGATFPANGLPVAEGGPLYAFWYFLLSFVQPDRVQLYYLNQRVLSLLAVVLLYCLLRVQRVSPLVCVCVAAFAAVSRGNLETQPKVCHFVLCALLGGLCLASLARSASTRIVVLGLAALIASYARPEYFAAFLFLAAAACWAVIRSKSTKLQYAAFALAAVAALLLLALLGPPVSGKGERSVLAFQQHFAMNWVEWTHSDLSPYTDQQQIVRTCFGDAKSGPQCALSNPALVAKHVWSNVRSIPKGLALLLIHPSRSLTGESHYARIRGSHLLLLLSLIILVLGGFRWSEVRRTWLEVRWLALATAVFVSLPLAASAMLFPEPRYALLIAVPSLATIVVLLRECNPPLGRGSALLAPVAGLFFLLQAPPAAETSGDLPVRHAIEFLASLRVHRDVYLLEADGGFHLYLPPNWHRVAEYEKAEPFTAFAKHRSIGAILLTGPLERDSRFRSDPEWLDFLAKPEDSGFQRMAVPGTTWSLLVRPEILDQTAGNAGEETAQTIAPVTQSVLADSGPGGA